MIDQVSDEATTREIRQSLLVRFSNLHNFAGALLVGSEEKRKTAHSLEGGGGGASLRESVYFKFWSYKEALNAERHACTYSGASI